MNKFLAALLASVSVLGVYANNSGATGYRDWAFQSQSSPNWLERTHVYFRFMAAGDGMGEGTDAPAFLAVQPPDTAAGHAGIQVTADSGQFTPSAGEVGGSPFAEEGFVNVRDFGAVPDDGKPDDAAFAAAVAEAAANGYRKIYVPAGEWNLTYVKFPTHFGRWIFRGEGRADGGERVEKFTKIRCANTSGPCLDFTAVRLMEASDFVLEGNQWQTTVDMIAKSSDTMVWRPENWVKKGNSLDRYEHQSGLAWDYQQSSSPWSAQVLVERVKINGFVVGVSISPSAGNMQADTYKFRDCKFEGNVYGVSVGQDQCRSIDFENVWMNMGYCAYVNNRFGRGNGSAFNITGGQYTSLFRLFECTNAYRGQMAVTGIFCEAIGIIGSINGLGVNTNAVAFSGCEFGLDDNGYDGVTTSWVTPFCTISTGGNVVFTGCNIHSKKKNIGLSGQYVINACTFTETRPVFPFWTSVNCIGRPLFDGAIQLTDQVDVAGDIRKTPRYGVSLIRRYGYQQAPYAVVTPATVHVPYWHGLWLPYPDTRARQFEWPIPAKETGWFRPGDFLDCQASGGLIPGLGTDFGQTMLPGLEVMEVKATSLVLRKVAPEMRVESKYRGGQVWTEPYLWVTSDPVVAKADGAAVECANAGLLRPGDFVHDGHQVCRVLSVSGNRVTFNRAVKAGELKSVK